MFESRLYIVEVAFVYIYTVHNSHANAMLGVGLDESGGVAACCRVGNTVNEIITNWLVLSISDLV